MRKPGHKIFIISFSLSVCLHFVAAKVSAQEARKIDETTYLRCDLSEVPQITDSPMPLFKALADDQEARAAIIVYGMEGFARRYANNVKRWLSEVRGIKAERFVTMYGGPSKEERLELWLIQRGAALPKVDSAEDYKIAVLFDTYIYWHGEYCGPDRPSALAEFAEALKRHAGWRGYIIVRPHRNKRGVSAGDANWDPDGYVSRQQALGYAAKDRLYLTKKFSFNPERVKAVVGSDDKWTHGELWLVPPGAEPPVAKAKSSIK